MRHEPIMHIQYTCCSSVLTFLFYTRISCMYIYLTGYRILDFYHKEVGGEGCLKHLNIVLKKKYKDIKNLEFWKNRPDQATQIWVVFFVLSKPHLLLVAVLYINGDGTLYYTYNITNFVFYWSSHAVLQEFVCLSVWMSTDNYTELIRGKL